MEHWHWPQYGLAFWYGLALFDRAARLVTSVLKDDEHRAGNAFGNMALILLIVVMLHCGGFW